MVYSHSYSTAFYDSYTLITIVIIKMLLLYMYVLRPIFFRSNIEY